MPPELSIWTIGHSTRSIEEFTAALKAFNIQTLVDVRSFPGSRRYPHFNKENLTKSLEEQGIQYVHLPSLGGRRRARPDSVNIAWRNEGFRGYADYMETAEFREGVDALMKYAAAAPTAIMCSEAVWWRCHRSLISDFLKVTGHDVVHILSERKSEAHPFTSAARIIDGRLSYRGVLET